MHLVHRYVTVRSNAREARESTDAKLEAERRRTDDELRGRSEALREDADEVIKRARARAHAVLEIARSRQDRSLAREGVSKDAKATVAREREVEDATLDAEQSTADAALHEEREKRRRAIVQLLAIERAETDSMLAFERTIADRMVAARDDMLGVVSHDLRARLHVLLLKAAMIIDEHPQDQRLVRDADVMQRTVAQMSKLIDDLLDVASMEGGRAHVARINTDLAAVVANEVDTQRAAAETRSIQLSLETTEQAIITEIDPARIGRVVMNLLTNAIKFTPAGGRITVGVSRYGDEAEISVTDTGTGIAADQLDSVFERFQQIGSESRRSGYGLGLYIARAIVTAHEGRIWAESPEGKGSTFRVRLPLRRASGPAPLAV